MKELSFLEDINHRSRERIKELGEVFTPESHVDELLDLLTKDEVSVWSDEETSFFEPCSGHGNIALSIYKRRLEGIYRKSTVQNLIEKTEIPFYAVANSLNTLWAIDIDPKNVENCRGRILRQTLDFIKKKLNIENDIILLSMKKEYFAHVLSAIKWHVAENETLSAMSNPEFAKSNANLTSAGTKWFLKNGHRQLDFNLSWLNFYRSCEASQTIPLEYARSLRFIDAVIAGKLKGFEDYGFAKITIDMINSKNTARKSVKSLMIGL